ncbi:MAG TPA: allophanate hydrolase subunit 2 family protein, partial [Mycobacterium sp.]|nr:allophanate hydrolase subunit 2 family protein [Mycobacterium sp.]
MTRVIVESVGMLALLQDHGRRGLAHLGVGESGAADRASFDLANRLVGNHPGAACIEATLGRLAVTVD